MQDRVRRLDNARYFRVGRTKPIDSIIIHSTAGGTATSSIEWMNRANASAKVSYHYLVERDGTILRTVDPVNTAFHSGVSAWPNPPVGKQSMNPESIGIAFANRNVPTEPVTPAQIESALWLIRTLMTRFNIPISRVLRHRDVSPSRKTDVLPACLDWTQFMNSLRQSIQSR